MIGCCAQYDLSTSTFSPDGRVFQTDYAQKAVDNSGRVTLCSPLLKWLFTELLGGIVRVMITMRCT